MKLCTEITTIDVIRTQETCGVEFTLLCATWADGVSIMREFNLCGHIEINWNEIRYGASNE